MAPLNLFKFIFLFFSFSAIYFPAHAQDLPRPVCFQLEGLKPSCTPGAFCVGKCEDFASQHSRCSGFSVCGVECQGTAPGDPVQCTGNCYVPITESYTYSAPQEVCPGGRECEAREPDTTVCDENGCRVMAGACIRYSDCPSRCVQQTGSCVTGYRATPNTVRADGCGCTCNGRANPPPVGTCSRQPSSC